MSLENSAPIYMNYKILRDVMNLLIGFLISNIKVHTSKIVIKNVNIL